MNLVSASTLPEELKQISCHYVNSTNQLQIIRTVNAPSGCFERVVLPGQQLTFQTTPEAFLEVHTYELCSSVLTDKIACSRLVMQNYYYPACPLHPNCCLGSVSSTQVM